jgi:hypothetical protein
MGHWSFFGHSALDIGHFKEGLRVEYQTAQWMVTMGGGLDPGGGLRPRSGGRRFLVLLPKPVLSAL